MEGFGGPAQPSPTIGQALNAGFFGFRRTLRRWRNGVSISVSHDPVCHFPHLPARSVAQGRRISLADDVARVRVCRSTAISCTARRLPASSWRATCWSRRQPTRRSASGGCLRTYILLSGRVRVSPFLRAKRTPRGSCAWSAHDPGCVKTRGWI